MAWLPFPRGSVEVHQGRTRGACCFCHQLLTNLRKHAGHSRGMPEAHPGTPRARQHPGGPRCTPGRPSACLVCPWQTPSGLEGCLRAHRSHIRGLGDAGRDDRGWRLMAGKAGVQAVARQESRATRHTPGLKRQATNHRPQFASHESQVPRRKRREGRLLFPSTHLVASSRLAGTVPLK